MPSKSTVARLQKQSTAPTVAAQAKVFLEHGKTRKRKPFRETTVDNYSSQIENHIIPALGKLPIDVVGNTVLNQFVGELTAKGYAASTITLISNIVKDIRSSCKDEDGQERYPYQWDAETIDAPILDKKAQKRPIALAEKAQDAISSDCRGVGALVAVLAGTGLRIAEALAITGGYDDQVSNYWDGSKIIVRGQIGKKGNIVPPKTEAGIREVDIPEVLNTYLKQKFAGLTGYMFNKKEGAYRTALIDCGIVGGFHSLRRLRITHLRMQSIPEPVIHFWVGHGDETVTDGYTKVGTQIQLRKDFAEAAGLGFKLPEIP